jgi:hypothetical protein
MKVNLQFTVSCSQCPANDVFNALLFVPTPFRFEEKRNDADAYFESTGWLRLPSGQWVCRRERERKEAA